jgi:hypothetical protein
VNAFSEELIDIPADGEGKRRPSAWGCWINCGLVSFFSPIARPEARQEFDMNRSDLHRLAIVGSQRSFRTPSERRRLNPLTAAAIAQEAGVDDFLAETQSAHPLWITAMQSSILRGCSSLSEDSIPRRPP